MTKPRKITLHDWVGMVRQLEGRAWGDYGITGSLRLSDDQIVSLFKAVLSRHDDFPCQVIEGDSEACTIGDLLQLEFGQPRLGLGYVVKDMDVLLRHESARNGRLKNWYVADLDWMAGEENAELGLAYQTMLQLVAVFEQSAAVVDKSDAVLVFLPSDRLDIQVAYGAAELHHLNIEAAQKIINLARVDDGHAKQRLEILATAICDLVKDMSEGQRFSYLLGHLSELAQRCNDGYSLFASSFSFEKVRDQVEALRVDYTTRIHKALSDIQGQLLGIPISTIIVATQLKEVDSPSALMWGNVAVLVGALIFVILLFLAIRNQWHTLDVLGMEVDRQEKVTAKDCPEIAPRFTKVFSSLRGRIAHQRWIMGLITFFALVGLFLAFTMFWVMTKPALSIFWA